jgi:hypothetical protein
MTAPATPAAATAATAIVPPKTFTIKAPKSTGITLTFKYINEVNKNSNYQVSRNNVLKWVVLIGSNGDFAGPYYYDKTQSNSIGNQLSSDDFKVWYNMFGTYSEEADLKEDSSIILAAFNKAAQSTTT